MTNNDVKQTVLSTDLLGPNDWNPNQMTEEQFAELVSEVQHLGRICKPIIVRPDGERYVIIDGEHNWRAAREVGLAEVPCEVLETDDFECMRQTWKRNLGGSANPILTAQMFERMLKTRGCSQRQLAKDAGISEGTIRNFFDYLTVYKLHLGYLQETEPGRVQQQKDLDKALEAILEAIDDSAQDTPAPATCTKRPSLEETANQTVSGLSVRQVKFYLLVPEQIRDLWLMGGASMAVMTKHVCQEGISQELSDLLACKLTSSLSGSKGSFDGSLHRALKFLRVREKLGGFADWDIYFNIAAVREFTPEILQILPLVEQGGEWQAAVTPIEWCNALDQTAGFAFPNKAEKVDWIDTTLCGMVRGKKLEREQLRSPNQLPDRRLIGSPDFIMNSHQLTFQEKLALTRNCRGTACSADDIEAARRVCDHIVRLREAEDEEVVNIPQLCTQEKNLLKLEQRFGDSSRDQAVHEVATRLAKRLGDRALVADAVHDGRLIVDILTERLAALSTPEFALIMCLIDGYDEMSSVRFWFSLLTGQQQEESPLRQTA